MKQTGYVRDTGFEIPSGAPIADPSPCGPDAELEPFRPSPLNAEDVVGRAIDAITVNAGTYGMGGYGFFGLQLGNEWLIISVHGAGEWMLAAGRRIQDTFFEANGSPPPWIHGSKDELSPLVVGARIANVRVDKHSMLISLDNGLALSIDEDPHTRPVLEGLKTFVPERSSLRAFADEDDLRRGVFLSPTPELWV